MILNKLSQVEKSLFNLLSEADSTSYPLVECKLKEMESLILALPTEGLHFHPSELTTWQGKLAHWWCRYARVQLSSSKTSEISFREKEVTPILKEEVEKCVQSKDDYAALLSRNYSLLKSSLFEDSTDSFDWVFRSYQQECNSSRPSTNPSTSHEGSSLQSQMSAFFPPASSLVRLSSVERYELDMLLSNATVEETVSPQYLQYVTDNLMKELSAVEGATGDISTLKDLLFLATKGMTAFAPYRTQAIAYDGHLFAAIFRKLREKERLCFSANYARESLHLLSDYFRNEIITFYSAKRRKVFAAMTEKEGEFEKVQLVQQKQLCKYCHEAEHMLKECPTLKKMLCFQCFKYGHSAKKCPKRLQMITN